MKSLAAFLWTLAMAANVLGFLVTWRDAGKAPAIYAGLMILTLAFNRPKFGEMVESVRRSRPAACAAYAYQKLTAVLHRGGDHGEVDARCSEKYEEGSLD